MDPKRLEDFAHRYLAFLRKEYRYMSGDDFDVKIELFHTNTRSITSYGGLVCPVRNLIAVTSTMKARLHAFCDEHHYHSTTASPANNTARFRLLQCRVLSLQRIVASVQLLTVDFGVDGATTRDDTLKIACQFPAQSIRPLLTDAIGEVLVTRSTLLQAKQKDDTSTWRSGKGSLQTKGQYLHLAKWQGQSTPWPLNLGENIRPPEINCTQSDAHDY
ncbi:hypothetical protein KIN20_028202 [Parelaphostrongylus tenuis]|uniref:Uncharacterized protein n=1 Tax=Parelaphostrongylus tenuis TaxID=148309 RepID=A0AAD5WEG4_PARTN|nr:hypothetical protein KIN20_028202 [Parelaphostrongylus tenuis]